MTALDDLQTQVNNTPWTNGRGGLTGAGIDALFLQTIAVLSPFVSKLNVLREFPSGVTPVASFAAPRSSAGLIAANDAALSTWFAARLASGSNTGWLWGQGQNLVIDTSAGIGMDDTSASFAAHPYFHLILEDVSLRFDNPGYAAYGGGIIRLCGNYVKLTILGDVAINRPFQPIQPDMNLDGPAGVGYRATYGQPVGIMIGGSNRYTPAGGQTVGTNATVGAQVNCEGRLTLSNLSCGIQPTYVLDDLEIKGNIQTNNYSDTAFLPLACGTLGNWDGISATNGGDDCFFAYNLAGSLIDRAGIKPNRGSLRNFRFTTCRGKGWGAGGYGGFIVQDGICDSNWAGGFALIEGPYANGVPTWAANNTPVKVTNVLIENPGNIAFPACNLPQYQTPNTNPAYAGVYIYESSGPAYGPGRLQMDAIDVVNPAGPAFTFGTATQVSGKNLRAEPGSTFNTYTGSPAVAVSTLVRTAPQAPAVYLYDAQSCDLDITLRTGPSGEKFSYAYSIDGPTTQNVVARGGTKDFGIDTFLIGQAPLAEISRGTIVASVPMQFTGSILPPTVAFPPSPVSAQIVANNIYLVYFPEGGLLTAVDFAVTAAVAGSAMRAGVFACNLRGGVGKLIAEATPASTAATGASSCAFATPLTMSEPFWLAILPSATISLAGGAVGNQRLSGLYADDLTDGMRGTGVYGTLAYGPLPATLSGLNPSTNLAMIAARLSA